MSAPITAEEFRALFREVSTWGRWGENDQRGAPHRLTPDRVAAAGRLVRNGTTVTLSQPLHTERRMLTDLDIGSGTVRFAKDYVGVDYHNDGHGHIDALCHVAFDGKLYDGQQDRSVTWLGAETNTIEALANGLVGRGVLLDVPRSRGIPWIEPGDDVLYEDLEAAEQDQAPSTTEGVAFPIHVLAINAMGVHLLDFLQFEDLALHCEREGRWEFRFAAAPLRISSGTGSPLNPIAVL